MEQRRVETVEEFKLRIATIICAKPEEIPAPLRHQHVKRPTAGKQNVEPLVSLRLRGGLQSPPAQRQTRRRSHFRCAASRSAVVSRAQRNRICEASQPLA